MVTDHLRIINEQIRDDVQCCDYLLNEDFCKISVCVCACVCMCVVGGLSDEISIAASVQDNLGRPH